MRKKSHISLARFLVRVAGDDVLRRRWKAFYVGNLLPDCRPSFLTVRHEYEETFELVERKIRSLTENAERRMEDSMRYMIDLGQVFHYIADYFTFPHNSNYPGSLKDHCIYEKYLKFRLRSYIRERACTLCVEEGAQLYSVEDILEYIRRNHQEYMKEFRVWKKIVSILPGYVCRFWQLWCTWCMVRLRQQRHRGEVYGI